MSVAINRKYTFEEAIDFTLNNLVSEGILNSKSKFEPNNFETLIQIDRVTDKLPEFLHTAQIGDLLSTLHYENKKYPVTGDEVDKIKIRFSKVLSTLFSELSKPNYELLPYFMDKQYFSDSLANLQDMRKRIVLLDYIKSYIIHFITNHLEVSFQIKEFRKGKYYFEYIVNNITVTNTNDRQYFITHGDAEYKFIMDILNYIVP